VGGAQLAAEENLPHPGARLDDRRQAPGAAGGRESEQVRTVRQTFAGIGGVGRVNELAERTKFFLRWPG